MAVDKPMGDVSVAASTSYVHPAVKPWWGERVNYYFNDKPSPWMFREKKRLILLQNCQNKKCKPEKRRKKRTVLPRRELNVNEMKISLSFCQWFRRHVREILHIYVKKLDDVWSRDCFPYLVEYNIIITDMNHYLNP